MVQRALSRIRGSGLTKPLERPDFTSVAVKPDVAVFSIPPERGIRLVGVAGIEPTTSWSQTRRAAAAPHPDLAVMIHASDTLGQGDGPC